ncbi:probable G-protein coupled receptor 160 [Stegostoma tigrinum]|uniref:probable G-protein coupled receptor 160 n=1 Tax=Stegostoma tigrinum TaxID=3053191 RepID=UPI00202AF41C|nr:probable G-protein coupled receptor 160 [Stegostoma tigrinum]XP_048398416.1 probable G-protein coupled receptor 160 [Stegostoma tigrinum]XP_048398417.1 probable G-protein coupled receptor 160 [Stegostoma tigrinum]XP_048398418.1 probable G-protein coupled receptor 160 [Stegostoma tigrinum]XP_048398419.1 probable G-protein coupled receptor 160 [Stegostoma tigrinum]XP_048398421.1 probable G-protein coupled receptor 160 [Stegostoma tigrinum]XP_048398422.1 probable G-protein coupled receptor 16
MEPVFCENCIKIDSSLYFYQIIDGRNLLLIVLFAKVILNVLILSTKRSILPSLIGYFCISLSLMDLALFVNVLIVSCFKTCTVLGTQIGNHHVCLLLQIFSSMYSVLHFPIFILSGLDFYLNLPHRDKPISTSQKILYIFTITLLWFGAIVYVFEIHSLHPSLKAVLYYYLYQCDVTISIQSHFLSILILLTVILVTIFCWSGLRSLVRSLKVISYLEEVVVICSHSNAWLQSHSAKKQLLTNITMCFLLTWSPFVLLQLTVVLIWAPLPAYMDLNVPWLCFMNSFLIGAIYWLRYGEISQDIISLFPDGFCHWKFCHVQQVFTADEKGWIPVKEDNESKILIA